MADPTKIVTKKARPKLGGSAASRWQKRQKAKGNCRACGQPRPAELANLCRVCQDKNNSYMKLYRKGKKVIPYVEGEFAEQVPVLHEKLPDPISYDNPIGGGPLRYIYDDLVGSEAGDSAEIQKNAEEYAKLTEEAKKEFGYESIDRD